MSISCNRYIFAVFLTRISKCEVNGYPEYFLSASRSGSPSRTHFHQLSLDFCKEMMTWKSWVKARVALRVATLEPLQFKSCGLMLIFQVPNRLLDTTPRHSQVKAMGSTVWVCLCVCVCLCVRPHEFVGMCIDYADIDKHRQLYRLYRCVSWRRFCSGHLPVVLRQDFLVEFSHHQHLCASCHSQPACHFIIGRFTAFKKFGPVSQRASCNAWWPISPP